MSHCLPAAPPDTAGRALTLLPPHHHQVGLGASGSFNLSAHWEAGLRGSAPSTSPGVYSYDLQGVAHMLQVHPLVESVRPGLGAIQGGCCSMAGC